VALAAAWAGGCKDGRVIGPDAGAKADGAKSAPGSRRGDVPAPVDLLLPRKIRIHPFTGTRTFDASGVRGIDVRIEPTDAFGDATKAFGTFRFELYAYAAQSPDPKGRRISSWTVDLIEPDQNRRHWQPTALRYQFKLQWNRGIPVGERFVLAATFTSPFTRRLTAERVFVSGQ
jgi:hypothetical protein